MRLLNLMDRLTLTAAIKTEAKRQGFELVGVTTAESPPHLDVYERWLAARRHGEMGYLSSERARSRRTDPRKILPECRSILALGVRHYAQRSPVTPSEGQPQGRVAAYAWGQDYHDVLPDRLRAVVAFVEAQVGEPIPHHWYTDTGPLLEREYAQRAGLGWIGKNTCLINPRQGSYFLLAEILLGVDLEPDLPMSSDHCGHCTRCLDACPTACILPDRTIDANRCISYLTIELKNPIPTDLRPLLGEWVFGCDICQEVCPWNQRFASPAGDPAFEPRATVPNPDLRAALRLTAEDFNQRFKGSPVKRSKRRGYLRNVAIALGNTGDPLAIPDLKAAVSQDPEPLVRGHAAWALGRIGGNAANRILEKAIQVELDPYVQEEIQHALRDIQELGKE